MYDKNYIAEKPTFFLPISLHVPFMQLNDIMLMQVIALNMAATQADDLVRLHLEPSRFYKQKCKQWCKLIRNKQGTRFDATACSAFTGHALSILKQLQRVLDEEDWSRVAMITAEIEDIIATDLVMLKNMVTFASRNVNVPDKNLFVRVIHVKLIVRILTQIVEYSREMNPNVRVWIIPKLRSEHQPEYQIESHPLFEISRAINGILSSITTGCDFEVLITDEIRYLLRKICGAIIDSRNIYKAAENEGMDLRVMSAESNFPENCEAREKERLAKEKEEADRRTAELTKPVGKTMEQRLQELAENNGWTVK